MYMIISYEYELWISPAPQLVNYKDIVNTYLVLLNLLTLVHQNKTVIEYKP